MRILVNGEPRDIPEGTTLDGLIGELGLQDKPCAAELNQEVVPKASRPSRILSEGDRVELVTLVGGG